MSHVNRTRAAALMEARGLDALVLSEPTSFTWATGAPAGPAAMWRRPGAALALVPADPALPLGAVVSDLFEGVFRSASPIDDVRTHPIWVDTADLRGIQGGSPKGILGAAYQDAPRARPTTFALETALARLRDLLEARGLGRARIGLDLDFVPVGDMQAFESVLGDVHWRDGSDVVRRLKMVKTPREIERLRTAAALADAGLTVMRDAIAPGRTRDELAQAWRTGVAAEAARRQVRPSGLWEYISVGPDPWSGAGTVAAGALVKADVGCLVDGYTSDGARTFSLGAPSPLALHVYAALGAGFEAGVSMFRPGVRLAEIHARVEALIRDAGLPGYARGHFGHGLGAGVGSEEWPFIAGDSDVVLEPDMVLAFETPFYGTGLGALMIEDQLRITETGAEVMTALPRALVVLG